METQALKYPAIRNYVAGQPIDTPAVALLDVFSPLSGAVISPMPLSNAADLDAAVQAAKKAFPAWSATPIKERVQVFYRYKTLLERDIQALADLVHEENGKNFDEVRAEAEKAVELTEFACSLPQLVQGEFLEVSKVEAICDHPAIAAVSFVGSTPIAKVVYIRATANLKRCVALGGAKNHLMVLPDAHPEMTASNVAASMSGCAGQRCMAGSTMVGVGAVDDIVAKIVEEARKIVVGQNLGSVINKEAKERIEQHIAEAEAAGAKVLLDGRHAVVPGHENGYYMGATVIDYVTPDMRIAQEEVFGPVLAIMRTNTLDEALAIENANPYGNAAAVFTSSGASARYVMDHANAGMIGVNIGVPVPREPFSFGGWNESKFGACDITGKSSIEFWTQLKKTTTKWNPESRVN
jgi:acyl-CoA reductase-like NAD-dependent aldehyde dehydrogenase